MENEKEHYMSQSIIKTDKVSRILLLYHLLMTGKHVYKDSFVLENGINDRTFDRDIEDLRLFLADSFSFRELIYDKISKSYYLTGVDEFTCLDQADARLLLKLLFSSQSLRKDEVQGLSQCVLSAVGRMEKDVIEKFIKKELRLYESEQDGPILKLVNDLYYVIERKLLIDLRMKSDFANTAKDFNTVSILNVEPVDIILKENVFILKCKLNNEEKMIPVNKIDSFKIEKMEE